MGNGLFTYSLLLVFRLSQTTSSHTHPQQQCSLGVCSTPLLVLSKIHDSIHLHKSLYSAMYTHTQQLDHSPLHNKSPIDSRNSEGSRKGLRWQDLVGCSVIIPRIFHSPNT